MADDQEGKTPPETLSARRDEIRREVERVEESATYASECQFEFAKHWRVWDQGLGITSAVLAGAAGVGGLSTILSTTWAGWIALLAAVTGTVAASIGARQGKAKAADAGNAYRALQQDARIFLRVDLAVLADVEARQQLEGLVKRLQKLNHESEIPSRRAWSRAKRQIERGSQNYKADQ